MSKAGSQRGASVALAASAETELQPATEPRRAVGGRPTLVEQVRAELLATIAGDRFAVGDKLPNEYAIAEHFQVSRQTVRGAIRELVDAGYLSRQRGNGTFVADPPSRHALDTNVSYTAMIREAGQTPSKTILQTTRRDATLDEADALRLDPADRLRLDPGDALRLDDGDRRGAGPAESDQVVEIERIRSGDGRPLIYSRDRIPVSILGEIDDANLHESLYEALDSAGHRVARATAHLLPVLAEPRLAELLQVVTGVPLLRIKQVDFDIHGLPVMLSDEWHVADAFDLIINRRAPIR